ncbi:Uncharacterized protein BN963_SGAL_02256 [Streptococcus gallolyticus]|uniref:ABC-2 family transporter protein n=1 Tax=Streptococcus gallolyticus TaxID=315405 RepID=A0A060RLK6_9STRE|nr:ABC transporter permease subunit [Streptococcus gallolyticus]CDO19048.1 Uncharacterized protein BN963_SGAL_02256 [Streptococcus gallolyticus]
MKKLYRFELKKIFHNNTFLFTIIALLVVVFGILWINFNNSQMASGVGTSTRKSIQYNQKIAKQFEGKLDDSKIKDVLANYLDFYKEEVGNSNKISSKPMDVFSYYIADNMLDTQNNLASLVAKNPNITIDEVDIKPLSSLNINDSIKNLKITSYFSWSDLFKAVTAVFIPMIVAIIIINSRIFSDEKFQRMDHILLTTKYGRNKLTIEKIKAGFTSSIFIFFSTILIVLAEYTYYYGFSGWDGSIQANFYLKTFSFPVTINNLQVLFVLLFIQLLNIILITSITMLISSLMNSSFTTMLVSLGVIALPKGLDKLLMSGGPLSKVQQYMPINNFTLDNVLNNMGFDENFFFNNFWINIGVICVITLIGSMLSIFEVYTYQKNYYIS